ncbi:MAG: hypothetical protein KW788_03055 [Candidatus Doudnabacteria bacterium]|nr:hypothetical protein [Candidatus Doudnabacteria bacterium]
MQKLLFIHPDHRLHLLYRKALSEHFLVDSAYDGLKGLRLIQKQKPHIIVSEYNLPILSGSSILRFVRNHHELFSVPFIFLSGYHPAADTLGFGANEWVVLSETNPEDLISKCHQHLKQRSVTYV